MEKVEKNEEEEKHDHSISTFFVAHLKLINYSKRKHLHQNPQIKRGRHPNLFLWSHSGNICVAHGIISLEPEPPLDLIPTLNQLEISDAQRQVPSASSYLTIRLNNPGCGGKLLSKQKRRSGTCGLVGTKIYWICFLIVRSRGRFLWSLFLWINGFLYVSGYWYKMGKF